MCFYIRMFDDWIMYKIKQIVHLWKGHDLKTLQCILMWALKWIFKKGGACHCALTECWIKQNKPHFFFFSFFINIESRNSLPRHYHISISTFSTSFCYFDEYVKASLLSSNFRFGSSLLAHWSCRSHVYPIPQQIPSDWTGTTAAGAFENNRELNHYEENINLNDP